MSNVPMFDPEDGKYAAPKGYQWFSVSYEPLEPLPVAWVRPLGAFLRRAQFKQVRVTRERVWATGLGKDEVQAQFNLVTCVDECLAELPIP